MRKDTLVFTGLDTHKEFTEVAYSRMNVQHLPNTMAKLKPQTQPW